MDGASCLFVCTRGHPRGADTVPSTWTNDKGGTTAGIGQASLDLKPPSLRTPTSEFELLREERNYSHDTDLLTIQSDSNRVTEHLSQKGRDNETANRSSQGATPARRLRMLGASPLTATERGTSGHGRPPSADSLYRPLPPPSEIRTVSTRF